MPTRILTGSKIGLLATPDQNGELMFDKKLNIKGYNSSGELGPPQNAPGMAPDINVDEVEVVAANK